MSLKFVSLTHRSGNSSNRERVKTIVSAFFALFTAPNALSSITTFCGAVVAVNRGQPVETGCAGSVVSRRQEERLVRRHGPLLRIERAIPERDPGFPPLAAGDVARRRAVRLDFPDVEFVVEEDRPIAVGPSADPVRSGRIRRVVFFLLEPHVRYALGEVHPRPIRDAVCQPVPGLFIEMQEVLPARVTAVPASPSASGSACGHRS